MALTPEQLETLALAAKRLKTAAGEREAHSLKDLIALNEHIGEQEQTTASTLPVRLAKIRFGGAVLTD